MSSPLQVSRRSLLLMICMLIAATERQVEAQTVAELQNAYQQAVAHVDRSIVRIETVGGEDLVGDVLTGTGPTTGCVLREDGYIITSRFNFLANPSSVVVTLYDGRKLAAEIVANDESRMLTLLKVNATGLTPLQPTPPEEVHVGQTALALGRTFDLQFPNVSVGIVSAQNRIWGRALQTDAKTSPLNYGGPLIDLAGRCLGIIVPLSPDKQGTTAGVEWYDSGIGFAIPLTDLQTALPRLLAGETLKPGLMGVSFEDQGAVSGAAKIIRVRPKSPADEAGLKVDDVVVSINGKPVDRLNDLKMVLGSLYAKDVIHLMVRRQDETIQCDLTLAEQIQAFVAPYLGILPDREIPAADAKGLKIRGILPESPAAEAGLQSDDVIEQAVNEPVQNAPELESWIRRLQPEDTLPLLRRRGTETETITATLVPRPSAPPEKVEPFDIPFSVSDRDLKSGRLNGSLPGDGLKYWSYIPENYNPQYRWGLLVWLHPSGNPQEQETLKAWQEECRQRGIILVGPRAPDVSGWSTEHEESIKAIIEEFQKKYQIDPARIVVMGRESSTVFATQLAFKYRELIRGLILLHAPLRIRPPDVDPDYPLELAFVSSSEHPQHRLVVRSFEFVRKMNFPAWLVPQEKGPDNTIPAEVVSKLGLWIDVLDRI